MDCTFVSLCPVEGYEPFTGLNYVRNLDRWNVGGKMQQGGVKDRVRKSAFLSAVHENIVKRGVKVVASLF